MDANDITCAPNRVPNTLSMLMGRHTEQAPKQTLLSKMQVKYIGVIWTQVYALITLTVWISIANAYTRLNPY